MKVNPNESLNSAADLVMVRLSELNRGDILPHDEIAQLSDIAYKSDLWGALIVKLKGRMRRERGIVIQNERGVGYRLLTHTEQLRDNPIRRLKRSRRQAGMGAREVACTPTAELTIKQREIKIAALSTCQKARRDVLRAGRAVIAMTKSPTLPLRKKPQPLHESAG